MRSEMCSLHLTHPSAQLEQWAADCAAPGEQSWTSCRSQDLNPQPWVTSGFKSNALSIRPTTAHLFIQMHTHTHSLTHTHTLSFKSGQGFLVSF